MAEHIKIRKYISNLKELKNLVEKTDFPDQFRLSECEVITDINQFINAHMNYLEVRRLTRTQRPYYERLKKLFDTVGLKMHIKEIEETVWIIE